MCNQPDCRHDPLDDDFSDLYEGAADFAREVLAPAKVTSKVTFETTCNKCNGSGRFVSYSGSVRGDCFPCKGTGVIRTKTDPKVLEANRAKAAEKRARKDAENRSACEAWLEANPAEAEWLREAAGRGFEFAASLWEALRTYGHFTPKQEDAVRRATAKSLERKAQWAAEKAAREANMAEVDIARIEQAFASAKASGLKWPKLHLADFTFSPAPATGRNAGAIYVKAGDVYLGKIADGKLARSRDCTAEQEQAIVAVCSDPHAAAVAYGFQTGRCSCCGRELTNALSIELGIGPVCREKWGWA